MKNILYPSATRRQFIQVAGCMFTALTLRAKGATGANDQVRLGLIGCGGRGGSLLREFSGLKNVTLVAVADPDTAQMDLLAAALAAKPGAVKPDHYQDYRKLLDRKDIDAVIVASPNHWHGLHTIHACQAGKDVYVEKPACHGIWEGQQMVAAARRYQRVVQVGTQNRSDTGLIKAFDFIHQGKIGAIKSVHGLCLDNRESIGKLDKPLVPPATVDYNLWLGPAEDLPTYRKQFHYDWHWVYNTGNGDIGNQGAHELDLVQWVLGDPPPPSRVQSFGGRFGWNDAGETANMQVAWFTLGNVPVVFEVNNLWKSPTVNAATSFKGIRAGLIVTCEGGEFRGGRGGGYILAPDGKTRIGKFAGDGGPGHAQNFIDAVRSRRTEDLRAPLATATQSASLAHLANGSLRCGKHLDLDQLRNSIPNDPALVDIVDRHSKQLRDWNVDLKATPYTLGPALTVDPKTSSIVGPDQAVAFNKRVYRQGFDVPLVG